MKCAERRQREGKQETTSETQTKYTNIFISYTVLDYCSDLLILS